MQVFSIDDAVPEIYLGQGILRVKDMIDRKIGDCIGIKRMKSLGSTGYPETIPTHVYIWFIHFFELSNLMADMARMERLMPGTTLKWIKFVKCIYERDMYLRQPVHDDVNSNDCSRCRAYLDNLKDKSMWWFDLNNDYLIRMTFKNFCYDETKFKCCMLWIKVTGTIEVELQIEHKSVGCPTRRNFRAVCLTNLRPLRLPFLFSLVFESFSYDEVIFPFLN